MENHHVSWENSLLVWPFSMAMQQIGWRYIIGWAVWVNLRHANHIRTGSPKRWRSSASGSDVGDKRPHKGGSPLEIGLITCISSYGFEMICFTWHTPKLTTSNFQPLSECMFFHDSPTMFFCFWMDSCRGWNPSSEEHDSPAAITHLQWLS